MNTLLISFFLYLLFLVFLVFHLNKKQSVDSYFVNKRQTHLGVMTMSLISNVLGTGATIVVISEVYNTGISYGLAFLISSVVGMLVLAACAHQIKTFGDIYKSTTMSDFFGRRFTRKVKYVIGGLLLLGIFLVTAIQMTAVSSMLATAFEVPYWVALLLIGAITLFYTTIGGFRFDLLTDFINGWVLMFFFMFIAVMCFLFTTHNAPASLPASFVSPTTYGGIWWLIGTICLGGFAQVANAGHWQRIMSAHNIQTVEKSFKVAIPVILIFGIIIIYLGVASFQITGTQAPERALFNLIEALIPDWLSGIIFAVMIVVFATAIDSQIIAASAVAYGLLYQKHDFSERESVLNARLITAIISIICFLTALLHPALVRFQSFSTHIALILGPILVSTLFTSNKKTSEAVIVSTGVPFLVLCALYPIMHSSTFLITTPLTLILLKYYDKWTAPRTKIFK